MNKNCLAIKFPDIAQEWHLTKNGNLTPFDVAYASNKKYWWKCNKNHEWETTCSNRTGKNNNGCPYCSNKKVCLDNCLLTIHPEIAKEWHPNKNKNTTSKDIVAGNSGKYWWLCDKGHEWESSCNERTNRRKGCPYCSNKKVCLDNCLTVTHPEIAKEWHLTKNGNLTSQDVMFASREKYWWLCNKGHEYFTSIYLRSCLNTGCPYCANQKVCLDNCLITTHPEIAKEWHETKNGDLTPFCILAGDNRKYWWFGKCNHEWQASCCNRTGKGKTGCPYCANQKVCCDNCLATTHPEIAKEWHPIKNGNINPNDVVAGTHKKYWFLCPIGHEYKTSCGKRTSKDKRSCPICCESKGEKRITEYLKLNNMIYKPQFVVKNIGRFDFAVKGNNNFFIEYHGKQHYIPRDFGSKEKNAKEKIFLDCLKRDVKKERFCKDKNIPLLIIPYWDYGRIEEMLDDYLNSKTIIFSNSPDIVKKYQKIIEKYKIGQII